MKVSDLPDELNDACLQRGLAFDEDITAEEAVEEWAGWHIGDPSWATSIIALLKEAERIEETTKQ